MNYQHIARLAELTRQLSGTENHGQRFDMSFTVSMVGTEPSVELCLHSWDYMHPDGLSVYRLNTWAPIGDKTHTTGEMIQLLEQIKSFGFREFGKSA